jgi:paraquat-inducible protein A
VTALSTTHIACHECDLLVAVPELKPKQHAHCPRCNFLLAARRPDAQPKLLSYSITALIFLALANAFPFITLNARGMEQSVTLLGSVAILFTEDHHLLSAVVFALIAVIPAMLLIGVVYVSLSIQLGRELPGARMCLRWSIALAPWNMAEIFLIGILVSFIKIVSLADVHLGLSFWAYTLFTLGVTLVTINFDRREVWSLLVRSGSTRPGVEHG